MQQHTQTSTIPADYVRVPYLQPHWTRRKEILAAHPEVKHLYRADSTTALHVLFTVSLLTVLAFLARESSLITIAVVAYCVGAFVCHAQWVLIHELTHDLAFKASWMNTLFLLICNLTHIIPSGISFRYHHRMHHGHLNETYADPDVPSPIEDRIFGRTILGKATWLSMFFVIQSFRTIRSPQPFEMALALNWIFNFTYIYLVYYYLSYNSLLFLLLSSLFGIGFGLHPLGVRWIAEHWAVRPLQETYSYYGPINKFAYNIGYHNEHHDFVGIPWTDLPKLRKIAPEYYEPLYKHSSYLKLLWVYLMNPSFTLKSRVVRWPRKADINGN